MEPTTNSTPSDPDAAAGALGRLARAALPDAPASSAARERTVAAWQARQGRGGRRLGTRSPLAFAAAAAAIVLVAALIAVRALRPRGGDAAPLTYSARGAPIEPGGLVRASPEGAGAELRFSDGTTVDVSAGSEVRVLGVSPAGAHVQVAHGRVAARVVHRAGAQWSVRAGPFTVVVHGTVFEVGWTAQNGALDVILHDGRVRVTGGPLGDGVMLAPGQQLLARADLGEARIVAASRRLAAAGSSGVGASGRDADAGASTTVQPAVASDAAVLPAPSNTAPSNTAPSNTPGPEESASARAASETTPSRGGAAPAGSSSAAGVPSAAPSPGTRWPALVVAGQYRAVMAELDTAGIDRVCATARSDALAAAADAARYTRRTADARRLLLAQRARFAGTPAAHAAAYLLGRLTEDADGAPAAAADWYARYLSEAPAGAFAAEALGREMIARDRAGQRARASAAAAAYTARFPDGPYAASARVLASRPGAPAP